MNLIDMQTKPDGDYKWIIDYKDSLTNFCILRPLKNLTPKAVSSELVDIFCQFGPPSVLQLDNCSEFDNKLLFQDLENFWHEIKIEQGLVESYHQGWAKYTFYSLFTYFFICFLDLKSKLFDNWANELKFVQFKYNSCYQSDIGKSPFE